jgi:hypothetical protein
MRNSDCISEPVLAYQGFKVDVLRDRIHGQWNVQAVVSDRDDYPTMLRHTYLQAKLRGLV